MTKKQTNEDFKIKEDMFGKINLDEVIEDEFNLSKKPNRIYDSKKEESKEKPSEKRISLNENM